VPETRIFRSSNDDTNVNRVAADCAGIEVHRGDAVVERVFVRIEQAQSSSVPAVFLSDLDQFPHPFIPVLSSPERRVRTLGLNCALAALLAGIGLGLVVGELRKGAYLLWQRVGHPV